MLVGRWLAPGWSAVRLLASRAGLQAASLSGTPPARSLAGAFLFFAHIYSLLAQEKFWL